MTSLKLKFITKSDAAFGSGDGIVGFIDSEAKHDKYGIPYLGGRTLKGILEEECANIMFSLKKQNKENLFCDAAANLFGIPGSSNDEESIIHISNAQIPDDIRAVLINEVNQGRLRPQQILEAFCAIRRQTAIDPETDSAKKGSLRNIRVILRETPFESEISFSQAPDSTDLALLCACVKAFRRAGADRNRGKGEIKCCNLIDSDGKDITEEYFPQFAEKVTA